MIDWSSDPDIDSVGRTLVRLNFNSGTIWIAPIATPHTSAPATRRAAPHPQPARHDERECVHRAAGQRHPEQLRLPEERDQREGNGYERRAPKRPPLHHEVDAEEHPREPGHRRRVRRVHQVQHREAAERVSEARHDRARSRAPAVQRPRERACSGEPHVTEQPPPVRGDRIEPAEHGVERVEDRVLRRAQHRVTREHVLGPPGPVPGADGPPHGHVGGDVEVVHVAVHRSTTAREHLPVGRGRHRERDREREALSCEAASPG